MTRVPGLDDEDVEKVFWPGVTRKADGIGMGLTVASELVEAYGGKMLTSHPGELGGASFAFDMPARKAIGETADATSSLRRRRRRRHSSDRGFALRREEPDYRSFQESGILMRRRTVFAHCVPDIVVLDLWEGLASENRNRGSEHLNFIWNAAVLPSHHPFGKPRHTSRAN